MKNKGRKGTKLAWDSKEDDLLKQYYGILSMKQLRLIFENRSVDAIRSRVKRLRQKGWTFSTIRR